MVASVSPDTNLGAPITIHKVLFTNHQVPFATHFAIHPANFLPISLASPYAHTSKSHFSDSISSMVAKVLSNTCGITPEYLSSPHHNFSLSNHSTFVPSPKSST
jgi:hypothetical protein